MILRFLLMSLQRVPPVASGERAHAAEARTGAEGGPPDAPAPRMDCVVVLASRGRWGCFRSPPTDPLTYAAPFPQPVVPSPFDRQRRAQVDRPGASLRASVAALPTRPPAASRRRERLAGEGATSARSAARAEPRLAPVPRGLTARPVHSQDRCRASSVLAPRAGTSVRLHRYSHRPHHRPAGRPGQRATPEGVHLSGLRCVTLPSRPLFGHPARRTFDLGDPILGCGPGDVGPRESSWAGTLALA